MNFLLGASIIILLLFPGLVFRLLYLNTRHNRGFSFTIAEELLFSLVPTLIIHLLCLPFTHFFSFSLPDLYLMVISHPDGSRPLNLHGLGWFIGYCLSSYLLAGLLGTGVQWLARRFNWDINLPIFRIHNEWYYLLRGVFIQGMNGRRRFALIEEVKIDALVEIGGKGYVYSGIINDFVLSKNEGLDRIYLKNTIRRPIEQEKEEQPPITEFPDTTQSGGLQELINEDREIVFPLDDPEQMAALSDRLEAYWQDDEIYYIPGDRFCLLFSEIKNLNLTYIIAEENNLL